MFERLTEFCFVFRFGFRASLLDFKSRIERLHVFLLLLRKCMKCFSIFYSDYSRACPSTGRSGHRQRVCRSFCDARGRSAVGAQPWLLQRLLGLGLFVVRCSPLVNNSL